MDDRRRFIIPLCLVSIAIAATLKYEAAGFFMLIWFFFGPVLAAAHLGSHWYLARSPIPVSAGRFRWAVLSNFLLVGAMLVQVDVGENYTFTTMTSLYARHVAGDSRLERLTSIHAVDVAHQISLLSLLIVACSWVPLIRIGRRLRREEKQGVCRSCGYRLARRSAACPECGT